MNSYRNLIAWQRCHELALAVYRCASNLPPSERYGLSSQLRRAVVSAAANIAEGSARQGPAEFSHALSIALGSLAECDALLRIVRDLGYCETAALDALAELRDRASAATFALQKRMRRTTRR